MRHWLSKREKKNNHFVRLLSLIPFTSSIAKDKGSALIPETIFDLEQRFIGPLMWPFPPMVFRSRWRKLLQDPESLCYIRPQGMFL